MGQMQKPDAEHRSALTCEECGAEYWTDSTQTNECPKCGALDFEIHGPESHDD